MMQWKALSLMMLVAPLVLGVALLAGCNNSTDSDSDDSGDDSNTSTDGDSNNNGDGNDNNSGDGGSPASTGSNSLDHATPETLFNSMVNAAQDEDYTAMFHALKPQTQTQMAMGMVITAASAGMNPGIDEAAVAPVLEQYGIAQSDLPTMGPNMQQQAQDLAAGLDDPAAFVGDMMSVLPAQTTAAMSQGIGAMGAATLSDVQIDGDSASAKLTGGGRTSDDRVTFIRIDGKWYIDDE